MMSFAPAVIRRFIASARRWLPLLAWVAGPALADNLVTVRSGALPVLPTAAAVHALAVVENRPIAFAANQAWVLGEDQKSWAATPWPVDLPVQGVVGNGKQALLLLGTAERVDRVAHLGLTADQPTTRLLPPLPSPLRQTRGALLGDSLFVAGLEAGGAAGLWRIEPLAAAPAWRAPVAGPVAARPGRWWRRPRPCTSRSQVQPKRVMRSCAGAPTTPGARARHCPANC